MKTIIRDVTATITLHEEITIEVPDDFTSEEIQHALKQEADFVFGQDVQLSNGMELDIEFEEVKDDEKKETCTLEFTARGNITFPGNDPNDWAGEAKAIVESLHSHDSQVVDLTIGRVDIYS